MDNNYKGIPYTEGEYNEAANEAEMDESVLQKLNELGYGKVEYAEGDCCEITKRIDFGKCEDYKEVCASVDMLDSQTRLLRVFLDIHNVCKNRFLAISVILVNPKNNLIISQKGKIVFTGSSPHTCKALAKEFCFTLPGNLCDDTNPIDVKVVSNYIYTNPFGTLPCKDKHC